MEKEFIPYELALDLKELGFDEPCNTCYDKLEMTASYGENVFDYKNYNTSGYLVSRPTFSQAFRWFREKYGLFVSPNVISYEDGPYLWFFEINSTVLPFGTDLGETDDYKTYEEAELECLKKLIEIVKEQK
jgi:hypothetical protein